MTAISVVMPVYNTDKYLSKAIESVLNQTFKDIEFIIIDNGSTDGSGAIIDDYAEKDPRIRVIRHKENVFSGEARNKAIESAAGEYLCLFDSDDWAPDDMLETMYDRAKKFNAQYVVAGYFMDYYVDGKEVSYKVCPDDRDFEQDDFRHHAVDYLTRTLLTVPWNKLYSLKYLREHNIKFRNTKFEDHHFNMDILMDVERVSMISRPFYHYYRSRQGTDTELVYNKFLNQKKRDHIEHTLEVYEHWGINDRETMRKFANYHMGRLVQCVTTTVHSQLGRKEKRKELKGIVQDKYTDFAIKNSKHLPKKMAVLSIPIKLRNVTLCYCMGSCIGFFKNHFSGVYYKMRAKVAQNAEE